MSQQVLCKNCNNPITWDNTARANLGTKRPLNPNLTIHECPNYKQASTAPASVPYSQQQTHTNLPTPQAVYNAGSGTFNGNPQEAIATVMNANEIEVAIKQALAGLVTQQADQLQRMSSEIIRLSETVRLMKETISSFINYNPTERAFSSLIETMMKYLPEPELTTPKPASHYKMGNNNVDDVQE